MNKTFILALLTLVFACSPKTHKPLVLVSKSYAARTYEKWLLNADKSVQIKLMYGLPKDTISYYLSHANGILISGGEDVLPLRYGATADTSLCGPFDAKRDTMESAMIQYALRNKIPLMCICRGHQMLNVEMGGTLYRDIKKEYDSTIVHPRAVKDKDSRHAVKTVKNSMLGSIVQDTAGIINSAHHQGVHKLGKNLRAVAYAPDGMTESIELADTSKHPFVLGVQWHPERMEYSSPFSGLIGKRFMAKVRACERK